MSDAEALARIALMREGMRRLMACLEHGLDAPHNDDCKGSDETLWSEIRKLSVVPVVPS